MEHAELIDLMTGWFVRRLPSYYGFGRDDLYQTCAVGLLDAQRLFNPTRGATFKTYATMRMRGTVQDALRHQDWATRGQRHRLDEIERAEHAASEPLGRAPDSQELADWLGLTVEQLDARRRTCTLEPYEDQMHGREPNVELQLELRRAVAVLPEQERVVIQRHFFEDDTLSEIGEDLGLSEGRICQVKTRALARLKKRLSA